MPNIANDVQVRWMIRRDMSEIQSIENKSFSSPWTEEDFLNCLRQRNCIGMVAERREYVVGYMIYELLKNCMHVLRFCVSPDARREGIGALMIDKLVKKLSHQRRTVLVLEVSEYNLNAQLFFKAQRFRSVGVSRGYYEHLGLDHAAYIMRYEIPMCSEPLGSHVGRNRISGLD